MNPYDEWYALVRACEIREALGGTVVALNVGPASNETTIRKALAIGADEAVRINADPKSAAYTAKQIAEYAATGNFDIIFFGKETIDYNGAEVGAMVAEHLGLPYISNASKLDLNGNIASLEREIEGGVEELEVDLPFALSAAKGMDNQNILTIWYSYLQNPIVDNSKRQPLRPSPMAVNPLISWGYSVLHSPSEQ
jgi:electron transfer flavoprotein beta subunit